MIYDIIIIGGGPAGATAGIYGGRAGKKVLLIEKEAIGGRILESPMVNNIPGYVEVSGSDYGVTLEEQLNRSGVEIMYDEVTSVTPSQKEVIVECRENKFTGLSLIVATGTKNRLLGLPDEESLIGKGISFCVTCDGLFYKDLDVAVVGGGNSAATVAIELSKICKSVTVIQNLAELTADEILKSELSIKDNIKVICNKTVTEYITKDKLLSGLKLSDDSVLNVAGVFLAIGQIPNNDIFKNIVNIDDRGYISNAKFPNIFCCGDCVSNSIQQVAVACGAGVEAVTKAIKYIDNYKSKRNKLTNIINSYPSLCGEYDDASYLNNFVSNLSDWLIYNGVSVGGL